MRTAARVLEAELDAFRAERPDYVISDSVAPWGQWVGKILGVPVVTSVSTFAFNRRVLAFGLVHRSPAQERPAPPVQTTSHEQGVRAPPATVSRAWRHRSGRHGLGDGPFGLEHRVHVAAFSALRRDVWPNGSTGPRAAIRMRIVPTGWRTTRSRNSCWVETPWRARPWPRSRRSRGLKTAPRARRCTGWGASWPPVSLTGTDTASMGGRAASRPIWTPPRPDARGAALTFFNGHYDS